MTLFNLNLTQALIIQSIATILIILITYFITKKIKNDGRYSKVLFFMNNLSLPLLLINAFLSILGASVIYKKTWLVILVLVFNTYIISYLFIGNKKKDNKDEILPYPKG